MLLNDKRIIDKRRVFLEVRFDRPYISYEDTMDIVMHICDVLILLDNMKELCEEYLDKSAHIGRELDRMFKKFNEEDRDD